MGGGKKKAHGHYTVPHNTAAVLNKLHLIRQKSRRHTSSA